MHPQFKKFLIESQQFALLNESLAKKLSLSVTAQKIKDPALRKAGLELALSLKNKAILSVKKQKEIDLEIDREIDKYF